MKFHFSPTSTARLLKGHRLIVLCALVITILLSLVSTSTVLQMQIRNNQPLAAAPQDPSPTPEVTNSPQPTPSESPLSSVSPTPKIVSSNKILFGIGSQAGPAMNFRIVKESPMHMLSSWYNGPSDLEWMAVQKNDAIKRVYAGGYTVHIVTWSDPKTENFSTSHGPVCGTPYPVSSQILDDMKRLAQIWAGPTPIYVTLFTEFQTYTCTNNTWNGNENYYNALKDNFRKIKDIFHQNAPGSKVALSWGGWQTRYDDPANKAGRSFMPYFDDIMRESDFTAFQAMESDTNINEIQSMTSYLAKFGKPIMVSHYKPDNSSDAVFQKDLEWLFTDETIKQLTAKGLFAFSFMHEEMLDKSETNYQIVKNGVVKYGK